MNIAIAADHAGFALKNRLAAELKNWGHAVDDLGASQYDKTDDYPDFAQAVAKAVQTKSAQRGILLCGSGVGVCVVANKFKGVRAAVCHDTYSARQGVEHDDMNILCIGAKIIGEELLFEIARAFINATLATEEKFARRLRKLNAIEDANP